MTAQHTPLSYHEVAYPNLPFAISHPDRLATVGRLRGLAPAKVETCRVLEIGCGGGGNLLPMAATLPQANFVGIDSSAEQIAAGQAVVDKLNLANIRLEPRDLRELDASFGRFDYIIVHGVFCWTEEDLRAEILRCCQERLEEEGIVYLNLNVYPGWHIQETLRTLLLATGGQRDGLEQAERSRRLLSAFSQMLSLQNTVWSSLIKKEVDQAASRSNEFLFHAYLNVHNRPIYFHDFVQMASQAQLAYFGDASNQIGWSSLAFPETAQQLAQLSDDPLVREQFWDALQQRTSRFALLCHGHRTLADDSAAGSLGPGARGQWLRELHVAADIRRLQDDLGRPVEGAFRLADERTMHIGDAAAQAVLQRLAAQWPGSVSVGELCLVADADVLGLDRPMREVPWIETLVRLYAADLLQLTASPTRCATAVAPRPKTTAYIRWQAEEAVGVTNLKHQFLQLGDADRQLLRLLDGTREVSELTGALSAETLSAESLAAESSLAAVTNRLRRLARHALLIPG